MPTSCLLVHKLELGTSEYASMGENCQLCNLLCVGFYPGTTIPYVEPRAIWVITSLLHGYLKGVSH